MNKYKITNWKERPKSTGDWEKFMQEAKVCTGL
jgi:hypothetical protein